MPVFSAPHAHVPREAHGRADLLSTVQDDFVSSGCTVLASVKAGMLGGQQQGQQRVAVELHDHP